MCIIISNYVMSESNKNKKEKEKDALILKIKDPKR